MVTRNPGDYEKMFPWRKYLIDIDKGENVDNLQPDTPEKVKKALKKYLQKMGNRRLI